MKNPRDQFLNRTRKAITLIGMSGSGKTHLSSILAPQGWVHYSCDYEIGTKSLTSELNAPVTIEDLSPLSAFVGQLGNPAMGGLGLDEFKRRQKMYYDAEYRSLASLGAVMAQTKSNFLNDSTGSLCEIMDDDLLNQVGQQTLFVYTKVSEEDEARLIERAVAYPKPLFFPPAQFDGWLKDFMTERGIANVAEITPDDFSRWIFPLLFRSRLPKYQRLADRYGVTIPSGELRHIQSEQDFIDTVAGALA